MTQRFWMWVDIIGIFTTFGFALYGIWCAAESAMRWLGW